MNYCVLVFPVPDHAADARLPEWVAAPAVVGVRPASAYDYESLHSERPARLVADSRTLGVQRTGAVLSNIGLMTADVNPEHAGIYLADAVR